MLNPDARAALYQQAIRQVEAELERVNAALAAMERDDEYLPGVRQTHIGEGENMPKLSDTAWNRVY